MTREEIIAAKNELITIRNNKLDSLINDDSVHYHKMVECIENQYTVDSLELDKEFVKLNK